MRTLLTILGLLVVSTANALTLAQKEVTNLGGNFVPSVSQNFTAVTSLPSWLDNSGTLGNRTMFDSSGYLTYAPNQMFLNSASGLAVAGTQNITVASGTNYVLYCQSATGTGVVTASGAGYASGAAVTCGTGGTSGVIVSSAAGGTLTLTGSVATVGNVKFSAVTYETSLRPGDNVETTGTAYFGPRFDTDPTTLQGRGLLIEPAATNIIPNSTDLTAWTQNGATPTLSTAVVGPDGQSKSTLITGVSGSQRIFRIVGGLTTGVPYTLSMYVKKGTSNIVGIDMINQADGPVFNFTTLAFTGGAGISNHFVQTLQNGWYRIGYTITLVTSSAGPGIYVGGTGQTVYAAGVQWETSPYASSLVPTANASAGRVADIMQITGTAKTAAQATVGSMLMQFVPEGNRAATQFGIVDNSIGVLQFSSAFLGQTTDGTNMLSTRNAVLSPLGAAGTNTPATTKLFANRIGLAWGPVSRSLSLNGGAGARDGNTLGAHGTMYIGSNNGVVTNAMGGWYQWLGFYNQLMPEAVLKKKTSPGVQF